MPTDLEAQTIRKLRTRIIPFVFILFIIAALDRNNIGFAALTMNHDLGFSDTVFGLGFLRQIEFAEFDMHLHSDFDPAAGRTALQLLNEVRKRVAVLPQPAYNRFPNNFSHIFGGGYAAGYYSYKWAEVLSADAYALFEERGVLDAETGKRFRDEILAVGGSRSAAESFRAFRGREPSVDALLRHNGMIAA